MGSLGELRRQAPPAPGGGYTERPQSPSTRSLGTRTMGYESGSSCWCTRNAYTELPERRRPPRLQLALPPVLVPAAQGSQE